MPRTPGKNAKGYTKEEYRFLNEYIGRITQLLRGAEREAGVALYCPIAMFQADLVASRDRWGDINRQHSKRQQAWDNTEQALLNGDIEYMIVHPDGVAEAEISDGRLKVGRGSYHTLVMPQLDFIPLAVSKKLQSFAKGGGTVLWADKIPVGAEHAKNDQAAKNALSGAKVTSVKKLPGSVQQSYSSDFGLSFSPAPKTLAVGRFRNKGKQVYLLVNRQQKDIVASVTGKGKVKVLDPSTGKISRVSLPTKLPLQPVRAMMLVP